MMNDVFRLYKKQQRYKEAYEICVSIGFWEDALQLLIDHRRHEWVPPPNLVEIFNYIRAGDTFVKTFHPEGDEQVTLGIHATAELTTAGLMSDKLSSVDKSWKTLEKSLDRYPQSNIKPNRNQFKDSQTRMLFDLLVRKLSSK
jgi:hypothetical protein